MSRSSIMKLRPPRQRKVGFELHDEGKWSSKISSQVRYWIQKAIGTSTGSPSDGLGGGEGSESTTSTFAAGQQQLIAERAGTDWEIDEMVVKGDEIDLTRYLGGGSSNSSGSPHPSEGGSLHPEQSDLGQGMYTKFQSPLIADTLYVFHTIGRHLRKFFFQHFDNPENEEDFQKMTWYTTKPWAFYGSLYLVINWVLYLGLNNDSTRFSVYAQVCYFGGLTLLTFPLPFLIATDIPAKHPVYFQIWFAAAVWFCGVTEIIQTNLCDFFQSRIRHCHGKDFLALMYYITAQPALMMFIMSQRIYTLIMQIIVLGLMLGIIIPVPGQGIFARNIVSFVLFSAFLQGLHFNREHTERRLFLLNAQLKKAYREQQKAQMQQQKSNLAKRRFASYIFHEVRVPLNNAAIAFHIMKREGVFDEMQSHIEQIDALDRSFLTMNQVLNDSLDLEKMDQGHFDIHPRPFPLHSIIRAGLGPLVISAQSRGLELHIELDERIDALCRIPSGHPLPFAHDGDVEGDAGTTRNGNAHPSHPKLKTQNSNDTNGSNHTTNSNVKGIQDTSEVWVQGDEVRLLQILTNLVSNAIKFTPENTEGGIKIRTHFVKRHLASGKGIWDTEEGRKEHHEDEGEVDEKKGIRESERHDDSKWEKEELERQRGMTRDASDRMERGEMAADEPNGNDGNDRLNLQRRSSSSTKLKRKGSSSQAPQTQNGLSQDMLVFRLEVVDQGPGVKPTDLSDNKLFQPFAQTKVGKMSKNGTGLGLAIVRQIVSLSGGKLGIRSRKGEGATFWVELSYPLVTKSEIQNAMQISLPEPTPAFATFNHHPHISSHDQALSPARNVEKWPTVAFSDDVKPPMLYGLGAIGTPPVTPGSTEMKEYGFPSSLDGVVSRPSIIPAGSSGTILSGSTLTEGSSMTLKAMENQSSHLPSVPSDPAIATAPTQSSSFLAAMETKSVSSPPMQITAPKKRPKVVDPDPLQALVVDDDRITRMQMVRLLQIKGCNVDVAKDGQEFLDMMHAPDAKVYDFVSMDNHMPVKTGEEAVKEIRELDSDVFIVGCTGNALTDDQRSFLNAGVNYVLTKPIDFELLDRYVLEARRRRENRRLVERSKSGS